MKEKELTIRDVYEEQELTIRDVYDKYFASLSDDELKKLLAYAGFEIIEDGGGKIIIEEECSDSKGTFMWRQNGNRFQVTNLGIVHLYDCGHVWLEHGNETAPHDCPTCELTKRAIIYERALEEFASGAGPIDPPPDGICKCHSEANVECNICRAEMALGESGYYATGPIAFKGWVLEKLALHQKRRK